MRLSRSRRRGLSEVIGTVLVAAMTLIAGAAIFGYVNGQYLEEKFTVVDIVASNVTCGTSTCASFTLWIYNTGRIDLSLVQVRLYDPAAPSKWNLDLMYNYSTIGGTTVDRVHDISAGASKCSIDTNSYETPVLTGTGA
ncbi:MAG: hypothetical protein JRM83_08340, partial [Nitrososphaerota archaeon]|nr:hypothetical protein [Nitrososphaerota archaeon]